MAIRFRFILLKNAKAANGTCTIHLQCTGFRMPIIVTSNTYLNFTAIHSRFTYTGGMMKIINTKTKKMSNFSLQLIILCEWSQIEGSVLLSKLQTGKISTDQDSAHVLSHHSIQILVIFHFFVFIVCEWVITLIDLFVFAFIQHNIPCELTDVNVFNGEHREPKFVAMNPHEEVPILADGSTTIFGGFVSYYC